MKQHFRIGFPHTYFHSRSLFVALVGALVHCLAFAANPSLPPVPGKARVVITSEPLRGNTADVTINGKKVASVGVDDPYSSVFDPGKLIVAVRGGKSELDALADTEYTFEIALVPPSGGAFLAFGLIGSSATADYKITLKETKTLAAAVPKPDTNVSPSPPVQGEDELRAAQRAVVTAPSNPQAWRHLGGLYLAAGEVDQGIRAYSEALRLGPGDASTLEAIGVAHAKRGDKAKVRETWQKLESIDKARADTFFANYVLP